VTVLGSSVGKIGSGKTSVWVGAGGSLVALLPSIIILNVLDVLSGHRSAGHAGGHGGDVGGRRKRVRAIRATRWTSALHLPQKNIYHTSVGFSLPP